MIYILGIQGAKGAGKSSGPGSVHIEVRMRKERVGHATPFDVISTHHIPQSGLSGSTDTDVDVTAMVARAVIQAVNRSNFIGIETEEDLPGKNSSALPKYGITSTLRIAEVEADIEGSRVTFVASKMGSSCSESCARVGRVCEVKWFEALNSCHVLRAAFPLSKHCDPYFFGPDAPAYRPRDAAVLINSRQNTLGTHTATCSNYLDHTRRICGCRLLTKASANGSSVDFSLSFHTRVNKRVSQVILNHLRGITAYGMQAQAHRLRGKAELVDDIKSLRSAFLVAQLGQSCLDACRAAGCGPSS